MPTGLLQALSSIFCNLIIEQLYFFIKEHKIVWITCEFYLWIFISNTDIPWISLAGCITIFSARNTWIWLFPVSNRFLQQAPSFSKRLWEKKKHRKVTFWMFLTFQRYQNKSIKDSTDLNKLFINLGFEVVMNVNSQSSWVEYIDQFAQTKHFNISKSC